MALCTTAVAQALDIRCVADGGIALCTEPTIVAQPATAAVDADMWTYNVCDFDGAFASRSAAWNTVLGNRPIFDADIVPASTAFEKIVTNACQIAVADSGWGYTIPANILCWTGGPLAKNRSLIRDFRKLMFSGMAPSDSGCNVSLDRRRVRREMARGRLPEDVLHPLQIERRSRMLEISTRVFGEGRQSRESARRLQAAARSRLSLAHARRPRSRAVLQQRRLFPARRRA